VKPAYNGTARDRNFSVAGRLCFIEVLEVSVPGTPDPRECKFSAKDKFPLSPSPALRQVSVKYPQFNS